MMPKRERYQEPDEEKILNDMKRYFEKRGISYNDVINGSTPEIEKRLNIDSRSLSEFPSGIERYGYRPVRLITSAEAKRIQHELLTV